MKRRRGERRRGGRHGDRNRNRLQGTRLSLLSLSHSRAIHLLCFVQACNNRIITQFRSSLTSTCSSVSLKVLTLSRFPEQEKATAELSHCHRRRRMKSRYFRRQGKFLRVQFDKVLRRVEVGAGGAGEREQRFDDGEEEVVRRRERVAPRTPECG